jgi:hypothetical protein
MARTTDELLAQLERFLPPEMAPLRPVLAGIAAMMRQAELFKDACIDAAKHTTAEGIWLTLLAQGYGVRRATGESDASLLDRLQNVPDALTVTALEDAANRLLADLTGTEAYILEHWANRFFCDGDGYCDQGDPLLDQHNAFALVCPLVGDLPSSETYPTGEHAVYAAIFAAIQQLKAAGVRWCLVVQAP